MNSRTLAKTKNQNSTTFSPVFGKKLSGRSFMPQSANKDRDLINSYFGHNFGNIQVESGQYFKQSCLPMIQTKLNIGKPGDKYEQEADRAASYVVDETSLVPKLTSREISALPIQRQETKKGTTEEEKYIEAAKKTGEAFLETPIGKRITDKAKELGEDFVSTLPGKIVAGTAAAGAVGAIVAKNAELPIQPPAIPLDKVTPGLSMKITYKGPVRNPTDASIAFTYKFGGEKKGSKKPIKTKSEQFREETARMAYEQYKFRESIKTPEQKAEDEAFMQWYIVKQTQDPTSPLYIPGIVPKKEASKLEEKKEEEKTPLQRKEANSCESATGTPSIVHNVLRSSGQPLDPVTRNFMESRFGHDFSEVRLHTDSNAAKSARSINAHAYTAGQNIVFGSDRFKPDTKSGRRLLAHELTHVIQQDSSNAVLQRLPASVTCSSRKTGRPAKAVRWLAAEKEIGNQVHSAIETRTAGDHERHFAVQMVQNSFDRNPADVSESSLTQKCGSPLPAAVKSRLEPQFKQSLDSLRIHVGEEGEHVARNHSATAVSEGTNIYFSPGAYAPGTDRGDRILRHEITHYLQQRAGSRQYNNRWPIKALEAEADLSTTRANEPINVMGRALASQPLCMKTFVSTVGGNPYLDMAVKFYQLWENETAIRIGSYQEIVKKLSSEKTPLPEFRIVAHANGLNLFLPLLAGARSYAGLPALGLQTRKALTVELGRLAHLTKMTSTVHGWLSGTAKGKALLSRLGLTTALSDIWKELIWWVVDEHFAKKVKEDPAVAGGPKKTTAAQRKALENEIKLAQVAVRATARSALPSTAQKGDIDKLRTEVLAVSKAKSWSWWNVPAGFLKERLDRLKHKDIVAFRKEVKAGIFEKNLAAVKGRVSNRTYIEIRGCNIGSNDSYLNGIREFFGTKPNRLPSISAPKLYQFFGTPGELILPEGSERPPVAESLKFLFEETFDDKSLVKNVVNAVKAAKLTSVSDLAKMLRYADIKAEFEAWWKMKQKAKGVANAALKSATLKDFQDFLSTAPPRTFPVNAPGVSTKSLWYFILLPSTAIKAILAWIKDQGYTLPRGADPLRTFFGGSSQWGHKKFRIGLKKLFVDWLGDKYPVPGKIYFPEDPEYKKNIRKLP